MMVSILLLSGSRNIMTINKDIKIGVIGLGYVGLPLAIEFGKIFPVVGFDVCKERISELRKGFDKTYESEESDIKSAKFLSYSDNSDDLSECNFYIVTVPTPIDDLNRPDLSPLKNASELIGIVLSKNNIVVYESTVYPGATEEFCVPILEELSKLKFNKDFFVGYSPERINPGDKQHRLQNILKVVSGSNIETAKKIDAVYKKIITAGTYLAESIKVAEASKVIENTQRDINIALMNELAIIFNKLNIDTDAVLKAAGTKWNFLDFKPGLVGGHCIGIDPYYLTYKSQSIGYEPEIILSGRRVNDSMGKYVAINLLKKMKLNNFEIFNSKILIMGLAFKENCPDIRNTKVIDIIKELQDNQCLIDIFDPWVNTKDSYKEYGIHIKEEIISGIYDAIILAVPHQYFIEMGAEHIRSFGNSDCIFYDVKSVFTEDKSDLRL